jgi:hypothetical protein
VVAAQRKKVSALRSAEQACRGAEFGRERRTLIERNIKLNIALVLGYMAPWLHSAGLDGQQGILMLK